MGQDFNQATSSYGVLPDADCFLFVWKIRLPEQKTQNKEL